MTRESLIALLNREVPTVASVELVEGAHPAIVLRVPQGDILLKAYTAPPKSGDTLATLTCYREWLSSWLENAHRSRHGG